MSRIKTYKQSQKSGDLLNAWKSLDKTQLTSRTFTALGKQLVLAQRVVQNKIATQARRELVSVLRDINASTKDFRSARPEARYQLVTRANELVKRVPKDRRKALDKRLYSVQKYLYAPLNRIPFPIPEVVSEELIHRIRDRQETTKEVLERCHIENAHRFTGRWAFALRMRYADNEGRIRVATIQSKNTGLALGLYHVVTELVDDYFSRFRAGSNPTVIAFDRVHIVAATDAHMLSLRLRGSEPLDIRSLGQQLARTGQCVLDLIQAEIGRQPYSYMKTCTRNVLVDEFGHDCIKQGVTPQQIQQWAKNSGKVHLVILDLFGNAIVHVKPTNKKNYLNLFMLSSNSHAYAIFNQAMRNQISSKGMLQLGQLPPISLDDEYTLASALDTRLVEGTCEPKKKLVFITDTNDIKDLMLDVCRFTKACDFIPRYKDGEVVAFHHPESDQIYVVAERFEERSNVCAKANIRFKNQGWGTIGSQYYEQEFGALPYSTYSNALKDIIKDYYPIAAINTFSQPNKNKCQFNIDICKCYSSCLANLEAFPIFSAWDVPEYFVPEDNIIDYALYYVCGLIELKYPFKRPNGFYTGKFVKYCLEQGYIDRDQIRYKLVPARYQSGERLQKFVKDCYCKFGGSAKLIVNSFIGLLGRAKSHTEYGGVTNDVLEAFALIDHYGDEMHYIPCGDLHYLRMDHVERLNFGHVPIYMSILDLSFIKLDSMIRSTLTLYPTITINAIMCDSIKCEDDCVPPLPNKSDVPMGEWGLETSLGSLIGSADTPMRPPCACGEATEPVPSGQELGLWRDFRDGSECPFGTGAKSGQSPDEWESRSRQACERESQRRDIILGGPGECKSYGIKSWCLPTDTILAPTNAGVDQLRSYGHTNAQTLKRFLWGLLNSGKETECASDYEWTIGQRERLVAALNKLKTRLVIDEAGLASIPDMEIIMVSTIPLVLLLDPKQHHAVGEFWIDYSSRKGIVGSRINCVTQLTYNQNSRFDRPLYDALVELDSSGRLSRSFEGKTANPAFNRSIAYTNAKVDAVNKQKLEEFKKANKKATCFSCISKKRKTPRTFYVGMPVISLINRKKFEYFNSQPFILGSMTDTTVTLRPEGTVAKPLTIPLANLSDFEYGWCVTTHKVQGRTIREPFNIYETRNMDKRTLFTAVSRAKLLE